MAKLCSGDRPTGELKVGKVFLPDNLWVKRLGTGPIPAIYLDSVLGKAARLDFPAIVQVSPEDYG